MPRIKIGPESMKLVEQIEENGSSARELCTGLTAEQLLWRPGPGRWSIAENLFHLKVTAETFVPAVDQAIEKAKRRQQYGNGPFRLGLMGRLFVWYVEPPPRIRLPAPKPLRPVPGPGAAQALPEFLRAQCLMRERIESANGLDLEKVKVVSPLARYIRMSLLAFFAVYAGHERRHLWQASRVRQELD